MAGNDWSVASADLEIYRQFRVTCSLLCPRTIDLIRRKNSSLALDRSKMRPGLLDTRSASERPFSDLFVMDTAWLKAALFQRRSTRGHLSYGFSS